MFVYRAIGNAVFIDAEPNQERRLNRSRVKSVEVERGDSVPKQFQNCRCRSQACGSKMDRQQCAMQKPSRNRGRSDQQACVSSALSYDECRYINEDAGLEVHVV